MRSLVVNSRAALLVVLAGVANACSGPAGSDDSGARDAADGAPGDVAPIDAPADTQRSDVGTTDGARDVMDVAAPDVMDVVAPDAMDVVAPDAMDVAAPDAMDVAAPDAMDVAAPDVAIDAGTPMLVCGTARPLADGNPGVPLIDLAPGGGAIVQSGDRVLDVVTGNLWDTNTRNRIAAAQGSDAMDDLAGNIAIATPTLSSITVHDARDGHAITTIDTGRWASVPQLPPGGAYIPVVGPTGINVWLPDGTHAFLHAGTYVGSPTQVAFGPDEILVANGPEGSDKIERIAVPSGSSTVSGSFTGTFHSFFTDRGHFLTTSNTGVQRVYDLDGTQVAVLGLNDITGLTGQGNYVWTFNPSRTPYNVSVYGLTGSSSPVAQFPTNLPGSTPIASGNEIGIVGNNAWVDIITLDAAVTMRREMVPAARLVAFASGGNGRWSVANRFGVIYQGTTGDPAVTGALGCGQVLAVAGSPGGIGAVATSAGGVLVLDARQPANPVVAVEPFVSSHVALSSAGDVLAASGADYALQYLPDRSINLYGLPAGTLIHSWTYDAVNNPRPFGFALAAGGTRFERTLGTFATTWSYERHVTDLSGALDVFDDTGTDAAIAISPDGMHLAAATADRSATANTRLLQNGSLVNAVAGYPIGWLDDGRVVIQGARGQGVTRIYDAQGNLLASPGLPDMDAFQVIDANTIFVPELSSVYDINSGTVLWSAPAAARSAGLIAGTQYLFTDSAGLIRSLPRGP